MQRDLCDLGSQKPNPDPPKGKHSYFSRKDQSRPTAQPLTENQSG